MAANPSPTSTHLEKLFVALPTMTPLPGHQKRTEPELPSSFSHQTLCLIIPLPRVGRPATALEVALVKMTSPPKAMLHGLQQQEPENLLMTQTMMASLI